MGIWINHALSDILKLSYVLRVSSTLGAKLVCVLFCKTAMLRVNYELFIILKVCLFEPIGYGNLAHVFFFLVEIAGAVVLSQIFLPKIKYYF